MDRIHIKILDVGRKQATQDKNQLVESLKLMHPIGRVTGTQEIANVVVWLLSDRSSFVLRHTLLVDRGIVSR